MSVTGLVRAGVLVVGLVAATDAALAQATTDMGGCKTSIMGALSGEAPMPPPMPMPKLKTDEPMPTGMAPPAAKQGDVGMKAAVEDKCLDAALSAEQADMDKKK